jgi:CubicO group peptidase (beta-lactamase class C family)
MQALDLLDGFAADHSAAVVVDSAGKVLAQRGDETYKFKLASLTKTLTAMAIFVAVEEGTITLDDPVGPKGATVRHLLSHASGISMSDRSVTLALPGAKRIYSNAAFEILGDYLTQQSGIGFQDYLTTGVLSPIGMMDTTCEGSPASGGVGTIGDLGRFIAELLNPSLITRSLFREATSIAFPGLVGVVPGFGRQDPCDWGLGFEIKSQKFPHWTGQRNSRDSYGHFGQSGTFFLIDPEARYGVAVLTDRTFELWAKELWPPFCDAVFIEVVAAL